MTTITATDRDVMRIPYERNFLRQTTANRYYPVSSLFPWQVQTIKAIAALSDLAPDWDSYGSKPISEKVIDVAIDLVSGAPYQFASAPHVVPISGGAIQLEWSSSSRSLEIQVSPTSSIEIVVRVGDDLQEVVVSSLSPSVFRSLLAMLQMA
jgi:hypothetical protein